MALYVKAGFSTLVVLTDEAEVKPSCERAIQLFKRLVTCIVEGHPSVKTDRTVICTATVVTLIQGHSGVFAINTISCTYYAVSRNNLPVSDIKVTSIAQRRKSPRDSSGTSKWGT